MNSADECLLHFDFTGAVDGAQGSLTFSRPIRTVAAYCVEEVLPALREVEAEVEQGLYAAGFVSYEAAPAFDEALLLRVGMEYQRRTNWHRARPTA